jgi:hypothetical protein
MFLEHASAASLASSATCIGLPYMISRQPADMRMVRHVSILHVRHVGHMDLRLPG